MKSGATVLKNVLDVLSTIIAKWTEDRILQQAAALSFFTFFSLAPLLIILIAILGLIVGRDVIQSDLIAQLQKIVGQDAANTLSNLINSINQPASSIPATILGTLALLLGALGVFGQIKASLNQIWHVPPRPSAGLKKDVLDVFRQYSILFVMILITGFLLLVSVILSAVLAGVANYVNGPNSSDAATSAGIWGLANFLLLLGITTMLFAAIYKILPEANLNWKDVWVGAVITAVLFSMGRLLIGLYLGRSGVTSAYGAAGSLVVLLLWINYSAQIFFLGAEFTHVYTVRYGSLAGPKKMRDESV